MKAPLQLAKLTTSERAERMEEKKEKKEKKHKSLASLRQRAKRKAAKRAAKAAKAAKLKVTPKLIELEQAAESRREEARKADEPPVTGFANDDAWPGGAD